MYKLYNSEFTSKPAMVERIETSTFIPFFPDNTDYQTFKCEVAAGTPLEDPEGVLMTQAQVDEFLETIP